VTLHPVLLKELLADEAEAARLRLGQRVKSIEVNGTDIYVHLLSTNVGDATIRFAGSGYDAEPFQAAAVTPAGAIAPNEKWPAGLNGGAHPILGRGFICIRGTYEYHCHPQHIADTWASHRLKLRLPQLLAHILRRAGQ
jgi:hypothetical protein